RCSRADARAIRCTAARRHVIAPARRDGRQTERARSAARRRRTHGRRRERARAGLHDVVRDAAAAGTPRARHRAVKESAPLQMKRIAALAILLLASCATIPNSAEDRAAAVRAALRDLGSGETIRTLVIKGPELRAALAGKVAVISEADVPQTETESLPRGYAKLLSIHI